MLDVNAWLFTSGTSCSVVEAMKDIDYAVVVSEPTIFGFHDFQLIIQTLKILNKDYGVIINKHEEENKIIEDYCIKNNIEIIGKIPLSYEIATTNAHGELIYEKVSDLKNEFEKILSTIMNKLNKILV